MRHLRLAWRQLVTEPGYSAVTILGLAAGFATCFALLAYVTLSFSYNRHVPAAHEVYAVKQHMNLTGKPGWFEVVPMPLLRVAEQSGMTQAAVLAIPANASVRTPSGVLQVKMLTVSPGFPQVFGVAAAEGDLARALARPDGVALTYRAALKALGTRAALGKVLHIDGKTLTVMALLADPPAASALQYELVNSLDSVLMPQEYRAHMEDSWGMIAGYLYVRLAPGIAPVDFTAHLQRTFDHSPLRQELPPDLVQKLGSRKMADLALTPLTDLYFDASLEGRPGSSPHGDRAVVIGLGLVGVLVLALAVANYVNLAAVRTTRRQPEIVLRKVLGASAFRLAGQLLAEALLVAMVATTLGLLLVWLMLPALSGMLDRPLDQAMPPAAILAALAVGIVTGLLAGLYPLWIALDMRPATVLAMRRDLEPRGGLWLRRALTVLQLTVAMGLTAATLAIAWQARFASSADPGFDVAPLLTVELPRELWLGPQGRQFRDALRRLPHVRGVAFCENAVGQRFAGQNGPIRRLGGPETVLVSRNVSADFFQLYGVEALAGRTFDPKIERDDVPTTVMLNRAGALALGFPSAQAAVGGLVSFEHGGKQLTARVIGIAPDLRHESLRETPQPMFYRNALGASVLTIRTDGDMRELERQAAELFGKFFPDDVPRMRPAASYLTDHYAQDMRLASLLGAASLVAILLSAFGIYVLSAYNVQRRAREIVLRKLYGAGRAAIARLLGREFAVLLVLGAVIGLPPAALAIRAYLASFTDHAPVAGWTLLGAAAIAVLVALAATARHTIAALRATPAAVLKT
ncbi:FtsX-like permease family protein [Pseudoduganella lutea]|uniref:FtsX-like permease family protein n=1 Tax=Pseudoduganella lutea TaxID=321985 RepID=A0A4P6KXE2_9BURK|nr:FtsX-like permease family protein [Pseudoduganella lutea]QBE63666.1 FtsX-like permease family protein [Pseudoduganella lutea]